jgi:hypothetical protein
MSVEAAVVAEVKVGAAVNKVRRIPSVEVADKLVSAEDKDKASDLLLNKPA